jgi:hypothetical protein
MGSNNSAAQTPGDANSLTPGAGPASQERPPTSGLHDGPVTAAAAAAHPARIQQLKDKYQQYLKLGTNLKHERDAVLRTKEMANGLRPGGSGGSGSWPVVPESDLKLGVVLGLESVMAFMVAFRALTDWRHVEKKGVDASTWNSTMRVLNEMRHLLRRNRALFAVFHQLNALCLEEALQCHWFTPDGGGGAALVKCERERTLAWRLAHEAVMKVERAEMRTNLGPWSPVDEAVGALLRILRRFADEEGLDWTAELSVPPAQYSAMNGV